MNLLHKIAATAGILLFALGTVQAQNKEIVSYGTDILMADAPVLPAQ
jgi:hypothetical protein